jgi:tetratricopeptide (TPR) repeat protein
MRDFAEERFLPVSTNEPEVAGACRDFYARLLRIAPGVEEIVDVARRFLDEPVLDLACAFLWLFGQTPEAQERAGAYLTRAEERVGRLDAREKAWVAALRLWHGRAFDAAAGAFEEITSLWPRDLPAAKAAEFLYYILGQQESGPRFLAHMERLADFHRSDADFLAMRAFAHELCGETAEARDRAEEALALTPFNPWAQHALEHVLLWEGSPEEAVDRMEGWLGTWDRAGRVIHCHNAWHVALMHLDRLGVERAFAVYDGHVWGHAPEMVVEQLDGIAFLWRAEMAGVEVETERYRVIVPHVLPVAGTLFMPFVSAHYAYALARAGEGEALEEMLAKVDARAADDDAEARRVWAPVGRAIIRGAAALGAGDAGAAAEWFDPVMDRMTRIGGSDAQDDLFRFAHWESLRGSGRKADARAWLRRRLGQKRPSPLEESLLAAVGG